MLRSTVSTSVINNRHHIYKYNNKVRNVLLSFTMWHQHLCTWDDSCICLNLKKWFKGQYHHFLSNCPPFWNLSFHTSVDVPVQVAEEQLHGVVVRFGQILDQFLHSLNFLTAFFDPCSEKRQQQEINMCNLNLQSSAITSVSPRM